MCATLQPATHNTPFHTYYTLHDKSIQHQGTLQSQLPKKKKERTILDLDKITVTDKTTLLPPQRRSRQSTACRITLARMGYKVGLADADVYGPSVPKMTGTEGETPGVEIYDPNGNLVENYGELSDECSEIILPIEKFGVKWMSIGYFARPEQALIWRGPMACNALKQMILQVKWGELDFLLIDLPPGTGDIHISLVHDIPLDGAIIVSTPQAVALDVEKSVNRSNEYINKYIYGIIEICPGLPGRAAAKGIIFWKRGLQKATEKYNLLPGTGLVRGLRRKDRFPAALTMDLYLSMKAAAPQLLK